MDRSWHTQRTTWRVCRNSFITISTCYTDLVRYLSLCADRLDLRIKLCSKWKSIFLITKVGKLQISRILKIYGRDTIKQMKFLKEIFQKYIYNSDLRREMTLFKIFIDNKENQKRNMEINLLCHSIHLSSKVR